MKKLVSIILCFVLVFSVMAGCGTKTTKSNIEFTHNLGDEYPLKTDETLSVWCTFPSGALEGAKNLNDLPLGKNIEEKSGVKIDYIHPSAAGMKESFNLMLASGELPDIIVYQWSLFPGGASKAIEDGYILGLSDIVKEYCPDFDKALDTYDARKFFSTDDGELYFFPTIWNSEAVNTGGMMLRKDWLDDLGLEVPETIDEWHTVLTAFKEKKGATAPLSVVKSAFTHGCFPGAWNIKLHYYVEDGVVKHGYMEPAYKEFLKTMIQWREEGLFDKNFTTTDEKTIISQMLSGQTGAAYGGQGGMMGTLLNATRETNPEFDLVAAPYPVLNKGEKCNIAKKTPHNVNAFGAAITTACKNVELAAKWLNFGYTQEGAFAYAFGKEGESFNIVNGEPVYTDLILKNPEGASTKVMLDRYTRSATNGGQFIADHRYLEQYAQLPQQKECLRIWSDQDGESAVMPPIFFSPEEQQVISEKLNAVDTYQAEMFYRFLTGSESLDNFDAYIKQMENLGGLELIDAYQAAYNRYLKR